MHHRILIVDDSAETREPLRALLAAEAALKVDEASDARTAQARLETASYTLLLNDPRMPGQDGMKLIEEVRRHQLPVAVIVLTGFGSIDQAVKAMRLGAVD